MSLFRKNKNVVPAGSESASLTASPQRLGRVALWKGGEPLPDTPAQMSYASEVSARVDAIRDHQKYFLGQAIERSVPQSYLPTLVADAMNAGIYPRLVEEAAADGGVSFRLLRGTIPESALAVEASLDPDSGDLRSQVWLVRAPGPDDEYGVETTGSLSVVERGEAVDAAMLEKLDDHILPTVTFEK